MPLTAGHKIGPYEIVSPLGAGGMGEVYRATDTNLGRQVALKVLPPAFAKDTERMARFKREAQVLASLNHPNIASIYGIEGSAIVMELVEGKDLAGPLPLEEALPIAKQIAEALEAAHEKGIVHRDLKPANVKITPEGVVKLLDFGLAKAVAEEPVDMSNSPTLSLAMTSAGMILGTAAYMSPEQARGKTVDRRADIWAFGVVLLETLTGKRTYSGDTIADTLAAVIKDSPSMAALPPETPLFLRKLIARCMEKDPRRRLRDIGEARVAIEDYLANPDAGTENPRRTEARTTSWIAAAVLAVALAAVSFAYFRQAPPSKPLIKFDILPPEGTFFGTGFAVSPDGRRLVYILDKGIGGKGRELGIRSLDSTTTSILPGTPNAILPFWSPGSRAIGFICFGDTIRIDLENGQSKSLGQITNVPLSASWGKNGDLLFLSRMEGLLSVPAEGGTVKRIDLKLPNDASIQRAALVAGGATIAYSVSGSGLYMASLDGGQPKSIDPRVDGRFQILHDYILYVKQGALYALRFDAGSIAVSGDPMLVSDRTNLFSASENGVLVAQDAPTPTV
jgi:serine/threonine protein kinase